MTCSTSSAPASTTPPRRPWPTSRRQPRELDQMSWRDEVPAVRGKLLFDEPLAPFTWFRVGGPADVLFLPADADDLGQFLRGLPAEAPVTVLGVGSNVIVRDGGVPG